MSDIDTSTLELHTVWKLDDKQYLHFFGDHFGVKWKWDRASFRDTKDEFRALMPMSHWCEDKYWIVPDEKKLMADLVFFCQKHGIHATQQAINRINGAKIQAPSTDICPTCNGSGRVKR